MAAGDQMTPTRKDNYQLQILSRSLAVLFAFSAKQPVRTLDDLSSELEINKTSLLRILRTLEAERFVLKNGNDYRLGARVLELGNVYLSTLKVHRVAQPYMTALAESCRQTVSLAILDDFEVVYIAIEHPQREVGIQGEVGGRHPANATALGKILLASMSESDLLASLDGRELVPLTHRTLTQPDQLLKHLHEVRRRGYAVDDEERGIGIRCLAAPVFDYSGKAIAGLSLAGPIFHMTEDVLPDFTQQLLASVSQISYELGYSEAKTIPI